MLACTLQCEWTSSVCHDAISQEEIKDREGESEILVCAMPKNKVEINAENSRMKYNGLCIETNSKLNVTLKTKSSSTINRKKLRFHCFERKRTKQKINCSRFCKESDAIWPTIVFSCHTRASTQYSWNAHAPITFELKHLSKQIDKQQAHMHTYMVFPPPPFLSLLCSVCVRVR